MTWGADGGLNDRVAAGGPKAAAAFGERLDKLEDFIRGGHEIHAEKFLKWAVAGVVLRPAAAPCGVRVRPDGSTPRFEEYTPCSERRGGSLGARRGNDASSTPVSYTHLTLPTKA